MKDADAGALSRRNVLIGGALAAASGLAFAREPSIGVKALPKGQIDKMMPERIGPWTFQSSSGLVLPPPDDLSDRLYDEISTRVYNQPNAPSVMLMIAYSNLQDGMLQIHRPEVCYPVGGFRLSEPSIVNVRLAPNLDVPCRFFSAESPARTEQVLYWTRIGRLMPARWIEQRWAVVDANLRGEIPDGLLVRMSMLTQEPQAALEGMQEFARALVGGVPAKLRHLLINA